MGRKRLKGSLRGAGDAKPAPSIALAEEMEHQMIGLQGELKQLPQMPEKPWDPNELPPMPAKPTLADFFKCERLTSAAHGLQSAMRALKAGCKDETIIACLVHDLGRDIRTTDHAYWGAQLLEPYVSAKVSWAVRYHGVCRFFADPSVGYEYPEMYVHLFGEGFEPEPYLKQAYAYVRNHRWYMKARVIALFDDYSFQKGESLDIDMFADTIGRNFKQPEEGLGYDNSSVAHMWRTLIFPTRPL